MAFKILFPIPEAHQAHSHWGPLYGSSFCPRMQPHPHPHRIGSFAHNVQVSAQRPSLTSRLLTPHSEIILCTRSLCAYFLPSLLKCKLPESRDPAPGLAPARSSVVLLSGGMKPNPCLGVCLAHLQCCLGYSCKFARNLEAKPSAKVKTQPAGLILGVYRDDACGEAG